MGGTLRVSPFVFLRKLGNAPSGDRNIHGEIHTRFGAASRRGVDRRTESTTERLLAAFKEITLSVVFLKDQTIVHITPLSPLQIRILELLDFPASIYTNLAVDIRPNPP